MTPTDRLIVALDLPPSEAGVVFSRLRRELGVTWFKVNAATLVEWSGRILVENMQRDGARIMLDLKVYDVLSTVQRIVRAADEMGAKLLTVHVDCVYAATKVEPRPKILAVGPLTSAGPGAGYSGLGVHGDGLICHPSSAHYHRKWHPEKLIVCPGIRQGAQDTTDDHVKPLTAAEAIRSGADMIVVGRPITRAADPVAAARAILAEMERGQ